MLGPLLRNTVLAFAFHGHKPSPLHSVEEAAIKRVQSRQCHVGRWTELGNMDSEQMIEDMEWLWVPNALVNRASS